MNEFASVIDADLKTAPVVVFDLSVAACCSAAMHARMMPGRSRSGCSPSSPTPPPAPPQSGRGKTIGVNGYDEARVFYTSPAFMGKTPLDEHAPFTSVSTSRSPPARHSTHHSMAWCTASRTRRITTTTTGRIVLRHVTHERCRYVLHVLRTPDARVAGWVTVGKPIARAPNSPRIGSAPDQRQLVGARARAADHRHARCALQRRWCRPRQPARRVASLFPDPNLLLGIPAAIAPRQPRAKTEIAAARARAHRSAISASRMAAIRCNIVRGWMQYLYDENGTRYIDATTTCRTWATPTRASCGRCSEQLAVLNTNTRYLQQQLTRVCRGTDARCCRDR